MEGSQDQPKKDQSKKYTKEIFSEAYQKLCKEMGYQIVINPAYVKRDDGSYSTVLQVSVGEMPLNETEE